MSSILELSKLILLSTSVVNCAGYIKINLANVDNNPERDRYANISKELAKKLDNWTETTSHFDGKLRSIKTTVDETDRIVKELIEAVDASNIQVNPNSFDDDLMVYIRTEATESIDVLRGYLESITKGAEEFLEVSFDISRNASIKHGDVSAIRALSKYPELGYSFDPQDTDEIVAAHDKCSQIRDTVDFLINRAERLFKECQDILSEILAKTRSIKKEEEDVYVLLVRLQSLDSEFEKIVDELTKSVKVFTEDEQLKKFITINSSNGATNESSVNPPL